MPFLGISTALFADSPAGRGYNGAEHSLIPATVEPGYSVKESSDECPAYRRTAIPAVSNGGCL